MSKISSWTTLMEWGQEMLARHETYTHEHFEDMPEVRDWVWTDM